ncbi:hypothetical protein JXJ21_13070 [candidate division KSB1 bacterium]|nr:hypothetical protein [candidate division KSB1 bacterium]
MIQTHIIEEDNKPKMVLMDYKEYLRLKEAEEDRDDYYAALETKLTNKKWIKHSDIKKEFGIE